MAGGRAANHVDKARAIISYAVDEAERPEIGTVKFFDAVKGFGFIIPDDQNKTGCLYRGQDGRAGGA
jgi:hypothetical protein